MRLILENRFDGDLNWHVEEIEAISFANVFLHITDEPEKDEMWRWFANVEDASERVFQAKI